MNETSSRAVTSSQSGMWALSLAIVCGAIVAYGYLYRPDVVGSLTSNGWAVLLGYELPLALIAAAIFHIVVGRKCRPGIRSALWGFVAIYAALIASGLLGYWGREHLAARASAEIRDTYAPYLKPPLVNGQAPMPMTVGGTISTPGDYGAIERVIKASANDALALRRGYEAELTGIGWNRVLDPTRLAQDPTLDESRAIVQKAYAVVRSYRAKTDAIFVQERRALDGLDISASTKSSLLGGFDSSIAKSRVLMNQYWDLEEDIITQVKLGFGVLQVSKGRWHVRDGHILFSNQADLIAFNAFLDGSRADVAKEQAIRVQLADAVRSTLDKLPRN